MTKCNKKKLTLLPCQNRIVEAEFIEEAVTSDGGILLLREIDHKIQLTAELAEIMPDTRKPSKIKHNPAIQTALDCLDALARPYAVWKTGSVERLYLKQTNSKNYFFPCSGPTVSAIIIEKAIFIR